MKRNFIFLVVLCCLSFSGIAQNNKSDYFKTDYIKSVINKTSAWQLAHPKKRALNEWTNGVFYAGVYAAWETTHTQSIYDALLDMGNTNQWKPFRHWYNADDITISQTYIDLYRIEKKQEMIQPTLDTLALVMSKPYPTKGIQVIKWWWSDALFMAPGTLVKMGITLNKPEYLKFSDKNFRESYDLLYNKKEHLFARDLSYVIKSDANDRFEANGKPIYWSRGNGWVMAGLVRILKELPSNYSGRSFYAKLFKEMSARLLTIQQEDGLWRMSLLNPEASSSGEVSGTGLFCYAFAWGINNGLLESKKYRPSVEKAWVALNKCVNEEGRIGWVQGAGSEPAKEVTVNNSEIYGTGAFLLAGSEVIKMKKSKQSVK